MIHDNAIIGSKTQIRENLPVGVNALILENAGAADHAIIESFCKNGYIATWTKAKPLEIVADSLLRSHGMFL